MQLALVCVCSMSLLRAITSDMTEIQFYHLLSTPLPRALPKLMEKAYGAGWRSVIAVADEAAMKQLDDALWEVVPQSFLPHGTEQESRAEDQPIYLTTQLSASAPNEAKLCVITDGRQLEQWDGFDKVLDLFDGHQPEQVQAARARWKAYNDAGMPLKYYQQQPKGGWECKAQTNIS